MLDFCPPSSTNSASGSFVNRMWLMSLKSMGVDGESVWMTDASRALVMMPLTTSLGRVIFDVVNAAI